MSEIVQPKPDVWISVTVKSILENIIPGGTGDVFPSNIRPIPRVYVPYEPPPPVSQFPALWLAP